MKDYEFDKNNVAKRKIWNLCNIFINPCLCYSDSDIIDNIFSSFAVKQVVWELKWLNMFLDRVPLHQKI